MKLNREIMRLTVPAILTNITVPVLGLCDTGIAGHLADGRLIGAIAVGSMMLNVLFWLCGFLRMGTTGLTAQAFGAGDREATRSVFTRSFILAVFLGVLILAASVPISRGLMWLVGAETAVASFALSYFSICIFGLPAQLATMSVSGWFLGMQNTVYPMAVAITTNVVNIALSFFLVFAAGLGFEGVALGTMLSNWAGLGLALFLARRFTKGCRLWATRSEVRHGGSVRRFFAVNTDIFFRSACVMGVSLTVTAVGARLGWLTLSANAIMMQFFILFSYFMDGFAFTGEALAGRFEGARDFIMLRRSVRYLLGWSALMALTFLIVYLVAWQPIVNVLTDVDAVREEVGRFHGWLIAIPPVTVSAFIFDGFFIGLTATRRMLVVTLLSALVFLCIAFLGTWPPSLPDNARLWRAFLVYLACRGGFLAFQLPGLLRKREILPRPL